MPGSVKNPVFKEWILRSKAIKVIYLKSGRRAWHNGDLCLFGFVGFLFLLESGKDCGLWLWHSPGLFSYLLFPTLRINISDIPLLRYIRSETKMSPTFSVQLLYISAYWATSNSSTVQWAWTSRCEDHRAEYIIRLNKPFESPESPMQLSNSWLMDTITTVLYAYYSF